MHVANVADHIYGGLFHPKELALQVMDVVALRPDVALCYLGIVNKCFEIMEGIYNDDATVTFRDSATGPVARPSSPVDSDEDSDSDDVEEDEEDEGNVGTADGGQHNSDSDSQKESLGESDDEGEGSVGRKEMNLKLREILFYEEKVSIFKARHGKL